MAGALPTTKFQAETQFWLEYNTVINTSPLSRKEERLELPGARWRASFTYPPLTRNQSDEILAVLMKQRGSMNTFTIIDPVKKTPQGTHLGTGLVDGASQTGTSLLTDGWTGNQALLFKRGDLVGFQAEVHMITQDISSSAAGTATLIFEPPIRVSPSNNETVVHTDVPFTVRLLDDQQLTWQIATSNHYGLRIEMVEVV